MRIRKPLTTTLAPLVLDELNKKRDELQIPVGTLLEDAWLFFKGTPTPLTLARREMLFPAKVKRVA